MKSSFLTMMFAILFATSGCVQAQTNQEPSRPETPPTEENLPKVYFYKEVSGENLLSKDYWKTHLTGRIDSRHGMHTLGHAESLGVGSQKYELVELD